MGFKRYGILVCTQCANGSAHDPLSKIVCSGYDEQSGRSFVCECGCRNRISVKDFLMKDISESMTKPITAKKIKEVLRSKVEIENE